MPIVSMDLFQDGCVCFDPHVPAIEVGCDDKPMNMSFVSQLALEQHGKASRAAWPIMNFVAGCLSCHRKRDAVGRTLC
jgi:hypothetical protein